MNKYIYLDTYVLQQDMRVRMPKAILSNMNAVKGQTKFDIFYDSIEEQIILKIHNEGVTAIDEAQHNNHGYKA